jgi:tetratricopeptide (TPR) repeat protein
LASLELIVQACARLAAGASAEALRGAEQALQHAPRDPDALYLAGAAHYAAGELAAAERLLRQAIEADASTPLFHQALGNVLQDRGALGEAIACYRRALRLMPEFAEAHNDLGTAYFAQGDAARAEKSYLRAAALRPGHAVAYANLGALYRKLGLAREARQALQRELLVRVQSGLRRVLDFPQKSSLKALAQRQLELGNPRLAARIAERATEQSPGDFRAHALLAQAEQRLGCDPAALAAAEKALALRPSDAALLESLAALLAKAGRLDEAAARLDQSLRLRPRARSAQRLAADIALARGDWPRAEMLAREAGLAFQLGEALFKQGRMPQAEGAYREAIEADARNLSAWIRLGDLMRLGGRLDEAEASLERAVELDPDSAAAWTALGMTRREKGNNSAAIECFEQALRLEPQSAQALHQIGGILRYENRIEEAERRFRQGLKARPGEPRLLVDLAMVLGDQMRYDEAFACIEQVLARDARSALALAAKGILLDLTGREGEAERLLESAAAAAQGDSDLGYTLGIYRLRHGNFALGWAGFELRRERETFVGRYRKFPFRDWQGEPLVGKTILVYPEQGLGDEIMYASCLGDLAARAAHVALECNAKLGELFRRSFPGCTVMPRLRTMANDWVNHLEPQPDYQVPIG